MTWAKIFAPLVKLEFVDYEKLQKYSQFAIADFTPLSQKIVVTSAPKNRISINTGGAVGGSGGGSQTLRQLKDVDATHLVDEEVVVYDAQTDKFVVEELPHVNGGEF